MKGVFIGVDTFASEEESLNKMIKALDEGNRISVGIGCLGHGTNNAYQEHYKRELEKHYGDKLITIFNEGVCSYSYDYELKK